MTNCRKALAAICCAAWVHQAVGQLAPVEEAGNAGSPTLTLDVPQLRAALQRLDPSWTALDKVPDIRLQLSQPEDAFRSSFLWDNQLKAVELRLPLSPVWIGYQLPTTGEEARAILSIKFGF